jgi:14-3-3 protein epsilon
MKETFCQLPLKMLLEPEELLGEFYHPYKRKKTIRVRILNCKLTSILSLGNQDNVAKVKEYKTQIEQELHEYCTELLNLVKDYLLPNSQTAQVKVFFHKMMADYYRYIAEYASAVDKNLAS